MHFALVPFKVEWISWALFK